MDSANRYARQIAFDKIGAAGQEKLAAARVAVMGIGALGTVIADCLCRAGVGTLVLVDRDVVDVTNLQRQVLFDEADAAARTPKALAAQKHLLAVNADVAIEALNVDVNAANVEGIIMDSAVVVDGSDNMELRYLLNEAAVKHGIPWIYGAAVRAVGSTLTIMPGEGPCLRCAYPVAPPAGACLTCSGAGVVNMATGLIACLEAAEAVKVITGSADLRRGLFMADLWANSFDIVAIDRDPDCPVCGAHRYGLLGRTSGTYTTALCGQDAYQVVPANTGKPAALDFAELAARLEHAGAVTNTPFMLSFKNAGASFQLFPDGRAIVRGVTSGAAARTVYSAYVGV